jgi:heavy metal sensor kinase
LRWRLIALYGAILVAVIAFFGVALALRLRTSLVEALDRELAMRARSVFAEIEVRGERWLVEDESFLDDYRAETRRYFVAGDPRDLVSLRSPLAESLAVVPAAAPGARDVVLAGERFRELAVDVVRSAEDEVSAPANARIVCGASLAGVEAAVDSVIAQVWIVGPSVLVLAMAGGLLLVSRALRPIAAIAATARRIGADDLTERIAVRGDDELARLGRTLNDTFARLQTAVERERNFTADASHELRTPLAVIAGNAELAHARERSADELRELFGDVAAAAARMRAIVDGLLLLARADAGALVPVRQRVSLAAIAHDVVRMQRAFAAARGVTATVDAAGDAVTEGDAERLRQVVANLVENAIRYNRKGGTVTVRVARDARGRCELAVEDTGIGMRDEDLPRVFERFVRLDPARARGDDGAGGAGLGLAIAKSIVQAHGGEIAVTSELGVGSRFVVSLPSVANSA